MKKTVFVFAFVLALIAFRQTAWAQSYINVTTEAELIAAVQTNNAQIQFANPISTTSLLEIKDSKTITIDLNGFALDRGCTSRGSQVIVVRNGSTLNLSNGTLTGGWGGNGGALDIETNTTVNLTDVIISGNKADDRGGGISNKGTLTMQGGAITNNTCHDHDGPRGGGGLFNHEGATATLTLIDNLTGAHVDLLSTSAYTFEAKTTDYASRFRLVFSANDESDDGAPFAFVSNGNIIVNGTGTLQMFDILGKELVRKEFSTLNSQCSTLNYTPGVYVLRLINGNDVKTQKIIIE